jgi:hypothetical protein
MVVPHTSADRWLNLPSIVTAALVLSAPSADALCVYDGRHFEKSAAQEFKGRLYAKTTLEDEFADSSLVVRGTVLSSREKSFSESDGGVSYRIKVGQSFKGEPPGEIRDFTERNSGGFYLDVGTQYLLFLNPITAHGLELESGPGAFMVNYNCGQSRPWANVAPRDRSRLLELSNRPPN